MGSLEQNCSLYFTNLKTLEEKTGHSFGDNVSTRTIERKQRKGWAWVLGDFVIMGSVLEWLLRYSWEFPTSPTRAVCAISQRCNRRTKDCSNVVTGNIYIEVLCDYRKLSYTSRNTIWPSLSGTVALWSASGGTPCFNELPHQKQTFYRRLECSAERSLLNFPPAVSVWSRQASSFFFLREISQTWGLF